MFCFSGRNQSITPWVHGFRLWMLRTSICVERVCQIACCARVFAAISHYRSSAPRGPSYKRNKEEKKKRLHHLSQIRCQAALHRSNWRILAQSARGHVTRHGEEEFRGLFCAYGQPKVRKKAATKIGRLICVFEIRRPPKRLQRKSERGERETTDFWKTKPYPPPSHSPLLKNWKHQNSKRFKIMILNLTFKRLDFFSNVNRISKLWSQEKPSKNQWLQ